MNGGEVSLENTYTRCMKVSGEKKDFLKIHKVGDAEGEVVYVVKLDVRIIIRLLLVSITNKIKSCSKLHD